MNKRARNITLGLAAVTLSAPMLISAGAFADTTVNSAFSTHYQANVQHEATLMQQAQASSTTNAQISALQSAVQNIAQQVAALYTVEQSLATSRPSIPQPVVPTVNNTAYMHDRTVLLGQAAHDWAMMKVYKAHHNNRMYRLLSSDHAKAEARLSIVDHAWMAAKLKASDTVWHTHPYNNTLPTLQQSILDLQGAQIHYTAQWIAAQKAAVAAAQAQTVSVAIPSNVTLPAGSPTSMTAAFSQNGSTVQTVSVPLTALANNTVTFAAPSGLAAGTYTVTVSLVYGTSTITATGSATVQ